MGTRRSSYVRLATWCSSLVLAGCTFEIQGIDAGLLVEGDGPVMVSDGAAEPDGPSLPDAAPPDLLLVVRPDLAGACPNGRTPTHVDDLAEGDVSDWSAEAPMPWMGPIPPNLAVEADNQTRAVGLISVRLTCSSNQALLFYPKAKNAAWDLSSFAILELQVRGDDSANPAGWMENDPHIVIATSDADQLVYAPGVNLLSAHPGGFTRLSVPLAGGGGWTRSQTGSPSLSSVNYIGISMATSGTGFKVWIDGVTFSPGDFVDCTP